MKTILLISVLVLFSIIFVNAHNSIFTQQIQRLGKSSKLSHLSKRFSLSSLASNDTISCPGFTCGKTVGQSCDAQIFQDCFDPNFPSDQCEVCSINNYCNSTDSKCYGQKQVNETCTTSEECSVGNPFVHGSCVHAYNSSQTTCQFVYPAAAGEKCGFNADAPEVSSCYGQAECIDGICQGFDIGERCQMNEECNPGSYCDNGVCAATKSLGEACDSPFACQTPGKLTYCSSDSHVCIVPYSKSLGEACLSHDECELNELACVSGKCAAVSTNDFIIPCTSNDNCTFPSINYTSPCQCSIQATDSTEGQCYGPDSTYTAPKAQAIFDVFQNCMAQNNCTSGSTSCVNLACGGPYWCTFLELVNAGYFGSVGSVGLIDECSGGLFGELYDYCQTHYLSSSSNHQSQSENNNSGSQNNNSGSENNNSGSNINSESTHKNSSSTNSVSFAILGLLLVISLFF